MMIGKVFVAALVAITLPPAIQGAGCHGMSNFRLAAVSPRSASTSKTASTTEEKNGQCETEYGDGAQMMDLEQMEGEFKIPTDLQHALNPLFEEDPRAAYFVTDHGRDGDEGDTKYVLKMEPNGTQSAAGRTRVAGQVFLELWNQADETEDLPETRILCFLPKPKYTAMSANIGIAEATSSSVSWTTVLLSSMMVVAVGMAAAQTIRAKRALKSSRTIGGGLGPSEFGGSYSILSASENDLAERLAPSSTELV